MANRRTQHSDSAHNNPILIAVGAVALFVVIVVCTILYAKGVGVPKNHPGTPQDATETAQLPAPTETKAPAIPPEEAEIENESALMQNQHLSIGYLNNHVFECELRNGSRFYLGMSDDSLSDAIYLNPSFEYDFDRPEGNIYYVSVTSTRVDVEYGDSIDEPVLSKKNSSQRILAVAGRTYDHLVRAAYSDATDYGIRWSNKAWIDGNETGGTILSIRIIRAEDGILMGIVHADIVYDDDLKAYQISRVYNGEAAATGELSAEDRQLVIDRAKTFLLEESSRHLHINMIEELMGEYENILAVEAVNHPYFSRLFDPYGNVIPAGQIIGWDLYAANISYPGFGYLTVYCTPQDHDFVVVGYDAFAPFDDTTFESFLFPEDRDKLNPKK